ncbi:hypothetical protein EJ377_07030 [Chryseobacterium arthrosphaerae]|uniref:Kelch repeat-containing protein n=1 Tax=Chryseobacterium arthrosphaerae TaxID=651561 RepID=A0A432DZY2_9FLAO|nr:hypothetical protein EJ377_07030 [Chryseobacterium arthrosphaerae]
MSVLRYCFRHLEPITGYATAKETKGKIVNNKLYVIGGFNGTSSNLIDVFDLDTNRWTHQYKMPVGVSGHSLAVADSKIFIVGDYDNQSFLAYFDTVTINSVRYHPICFPEARSS